MGLEPIADRRTQKLSGGETQRVRFAIALVSNPDLLVLDEPTVAMDVESRHAFWDTMRGFAARGKTIVFATHYLEEADANADRAVLMANGSIVADGPTTEIKAMVGLRTIRATLPGVDLAELERLPGVNSAERRGEAITLHCADSDSAIRALLQAYPAIRDIEIAGAGLEEAFLQLTSGTGALVITYTRYELLRTFRNGRFLMFSIGFPLVLYFVIAGSNRNDQNFDGSGISVPLYYMIGLTAFGTMNTVLSTGARIAVERAAGWNRQLRLTPLSIRSYFRAKVITAYLMAAITIVALYASGISLGVHLTGGRVGADDRPHPRRPDPVRRARRLDGASAHGRFDRSGDGRNDRASGAARRRLVPDPKRHPAQDRPGAAVLLAGAGKPRRDRRRRLGRARLVRDDGLDGRAHRPGRPVVQARHRARLTAMNIWCLAPNIQRVTRLTSLPGTTISLTTSAPSRWCEPRSGRPARPRAGRRARRRPRPSNSPRSLPFTCTA